LPDINQTESPVIKFNDGKFIFVSREIKAAGIIKRMIFPKENTLKKPGTKRE
jgi:hypothetical protein